MNIQAAFKLFDIRGEYPKEVDERLSFLVGRALALLRRPKSVLIASDTRETSPTIKAFLIDGLGTEGEKKIFDLSEAPIPQFYYTMASGRFDLGIMVTASHVSETANGFKMANYGGLPFDQGEILSLKNLVGQLANEPIVIPKIEAIRLNDTENYVSALLSRIDTRKLTKKIVLDVTKSSAVTPVLVVFSRLGINLNMTKSLHSGNPLLEETRRPLAKEVVSAKADLGIIWDSDGDRVIFVDRQGRLIPPSFILGILGADAVSKAGGGKVAVDVRAGLIVRDLVNQAKGTVEIFPAWGQYLKFAMAKDKAIVFGGETSGHYLFADFFNIDDGILAALRYLDLWERVDLEAKIAALAKKYYELPETNFPCPTDSAPEVLNKIAEIYRRQNYQVSVEDGVTVFGPNFKFNLRSSITEPFLRLNLETVSQQNAQAILSEIDSQIHE